MTPLEHALTSAIQLPDPLGALAQAALDDLAAPWRVAALGASGLGKTTLVNRLVGSAAPTGLGGVTRHCQRFIAGDVVLIDSPGLDAAPGALATQRALLDQVDSAIWVTDALRPLPQSERELLAEADALELPVHLLAARSDCVPLDEHPSLRARLRELRPVDATLQLLDLRHDPLPTALLVAQRPAAAREFRARRLLTRVQSELRAQGYRPLVELLELWREPFRARTTPLEDALERASTAILGSIPSARTPPTLPSRPPGRGSALEQRAHLLQAGELALCEWAEHPEVAPWLSALRSPPAAPDE